MSSSINCSFFFIILKKGLCTAGHVGTYATGDLPSWSVGASLLANGESLNVESPAKISNEANMGITNLVGGVFNNLRTVS